MTEQEVWVRAYCAVLAGWWAGDVDQTPDLPVSEVAENHAAEAVSAYKKAYPPPAPAPEPEDPFR